LFGGFRHDSKQRQSSVCRQLSHSLFDSFAFKSRSRLFCVFQLDARCVFALSDFSGQPKQIERLSRASAIASGERGTESQDTISN
jgi:hypothetical protein